MTLSKDMIVSAQVILRPASGRVIDGRLAITTANIAELAPPTNALATVTAIFRSRGFETGPFVGISISVTGTIRTFEKFFGMKIRLGNDNAYEFFTKNRIVGHELNSNDLPEELNKFVQTVVFPLPVDFGPN